MLKFIIVVAILVLYGCVRSKKYEKRREEMNKRYAEIDAERERINEEIREETRQQLKKQRDGYLLYVKRLNDDCMKNHGALYQNEEAAMLEYDERYLKDWKKVGMTPPSFQK